MSVAAEVLPTSSQEGRGVDNAPNVNGERVAVLGNSEVVVEGKVGIVDNGGAVTSSVGGGEAHGVGLSLVETEEARQLRLIAYKCCICWEVPAKAKCMLFSINCDRGEDGAMHLMCGPCSRKESDVNAEKNRDPPCPLCRVPYRLGVGMMETFRLPELDPVVVEAAKAAEAEDEANAVGEAREPEVVVSLSEREKRYFAFMAKREAVAAVVGRGRSEDEWEADMLRNFEYLERKRQMARLKRNLRAREARRRAAKMAETERRFRLAREAEDRRIALKAERNAIVRCPRPGRLVCGYCVRAFKTRAQKRRHMIEYHFEGKELSCPRPRCSYSTFVASHMGRHMKRRACPILLERPTVFICDDCGSSLASKKSLVQHRKKSCRVLRRRGLLVAV